MINFRLLIKIVVLFGALAAFGFMRLDVETDVVRSLPTSNKVIADALDIFTNHPIHDQIAVDIGLDTDDPETLLACAEFVENKFVESGLFAQVGMSEMGNLIPELALQVVNNLPFLFSASELRDSVAPRLTALEISRKVTGIFSDLSSMDGIGQTEFIAADPLGLKDLILAKMAMLAPSGNARMSNGKLFSADGRHLLVTARPVMTGSNTASARKIEQLISDLAGQLTDRFAGKGYTVTLTPAGSYRAALDNERIIRSDVNRAILLATIGIALLLLLAFPRPLIGLLALVPALAGTAAAFFVYSFFHSSISIMVLGFGGAIISITVDHGIAYLLFLDCPHETKGKEAAREVWAVGLMAVLTTIGAFTVLCFSGFPVFVELGQFTALGVLFSFLFVHLVFPQIFPALPPGSSRALPLQKVVDNFFNFGKTGAVVAALFAVVMVFYAKPEFNTDLHTMNTVSRDTLAADRQFAKVWGDIASKSYLMISAPSIDEIRQIDDALLATIEGDIQADLLAGAFVPAMIFPGEKRRKENFAAWRSFWTDNTISAVKHSLTDSSMTLGFAVNAFSPFFDSLDTTSYQPESPIPSRFYNLLGISEVKDQTTLVQFITITPGEQYKADAFLEKYSRYGKIFEPQYFSKKLGDLLFSTFTRMFLILAATVTVLLFLVFLSWRLTLITLAPVAFAYVSTLGTLKILGHPLDIPGLMLSIIILGMGIDYSIFIVRAHQRYRSTGHSSYKLVRMAVFMASASTLLGFGGLVSAEHSLLNSAGLTSLLGIGYSLIGAFVLLPPLLKAQFSKHEYPLALDSADLPRRVRRRYAQVEAYPRLFARFKLRLDPLFVDLTAKLAACHDVRTIVDIGCGYGVPAAWCLEQFKNARVFGIEPDPERVRIASLITGDRGVIKQGWAPEMPDLSDPADIVLMLDMMHYLDDKTISAVFTNCFHIIRDGGVLAARYVIVPEGKPSLVWRFEELKIKLSGLTAHYRPAKKISALLIDAGFSVESNNISAVNDELYWFVARVNKKS
nr:MMPL family transporter [Desulfobulbaceae bacterium]